MAKSCEWWNSRESEGFIYRHSPIDVSSHCKQFFCPLLYFQLAYLGSSVLLHMQPSPHSSQVLVAAPPWSPHCGAAPWSSCRSWFVVPTSELPHVSTLELARGPHVGAPPWSPHWSWFVVPMSVLRPMVFTSGLYIRSSLWPPHRSSQLVSTSELPHGLRVKE